MSDKFKPYGRQAGKDFSKLRVVLAPGKEAERFEKFVELSQQSPDDEDRWELVHLTEPEARHLRDWLCEQFGLPDEPSWDYGGEYDTPEEAP